MVLIVFFKLKANSMKNKNVKQIALRIICCLFIFLLCMDLNAQISLSVKNKPIREVIQQIEKSTNYSFFFNNNLPDLDKKISISVSNETAKSTLDKIFGGTGISYTIKDDNQIVLILKGSNPVNNQTAAIVNQQQRKITGIVSDLQGEPVIGATVTIKGTGTGTFTDAEGRFSIEAPLNSTLKITYIGYLEKEIPVKNQETINTQLTEDSHQLEELVVVGYGVQKKINLTGAISQISSDAFESRPINSVAQGLQGVIPNLNVNFGGGGGPGSAPTYNIRGTVSLNTANPLCLVDGVPMDINLLNPEDIESVTVLKDAASAAIYGARASAGVILVTTKSGKGSKDGRIRVGYTSNFQWAKPTRIPDLVNTLEYMKANNESSERTNGVGSKPYQDFWMEAVRKRMEDPANNPLTLNVDGILYYADNENYYDAVLRSASPTQRHTLNISRGTDKTNFYLSAGFMEQKGLIKLNPDDFKQYNVSMSINTEVNKYLTIGGSYKLNKSNLDEPAVRSNVGSIWYSLPGTPPHLPIQREDGHYVGQVTAYLAQAGRKITDRTDNWLSFNATLNLMPGWFVKSDFSYNRYSKLYKDHLTKVIEGAEREGQFWIKDDTGVKMESTYTDNYVFNVFTQYDKSINDHNFSGLVGFNQESSETQWHTSERKDLINENMPEINLATGSQYVGSSHSQEAIRGAFFRVTYNWKSRYLMEVNGRYDGTSKFPRDYRYKFFPSVSGAWRISEEAFMRNTRKVLDDLKLRMSYGTLGNQQVSNTLYYPLLNSGTINWLFGQGQGVERPTGTWAGNLVNLTPTWEKTSTLNFGLDISLFSGLSASVDVYNRKTTDMLTAGLTLPSVLGATPPQTNAADLETKGWELAMTWRDKLSNGLSYEAGVILADNTSKITRFSSNKNKLINQTYEGQTLGEIWGFVTDGIYQSKEEVAAGPDQSALHGGIWEPGDVRYKDLDGDGKITYGKGTLDDPGDRKVIGNKNPRYTFGIKGNLAYKGFDLNIFFQGVGKRDMEFTNFIYWGPIKGRGTQITRELYENTWREDRTNARYPSLKTAGYNSVTQTRYLENAAYIRLQNLTVGYTIPASVIKRSLVDKLRVYISGENLFEYTPMVKTFDPQSTASAGDLYPFYRSFSFGIQINL